jgi:metal-sulfur cluster biosynthetic enzyme
MILYSFVDIYDLVEYIIHGVKQTNVNLVFEPEWNKDMMSEEAKLDLGFM